MDSCNDLTRRVIGCANEVHQELGGGLLQDLYEACLCVELDRAGIAYVRHPTVPLHYDGHSLDCDLTLDMVVEQSLLLSIKAEPEIEELHEAHLVTYLRQTDLPEGLLINFGDGLHTRGIQRHLPLSA